MGENEFVTATDYRMAVASQSAVNLSGIVFEFAKVMQKICNEANKFEKDTGWKNQHQICRLYAEQILHLTRKRNWFEAYEFCIEQGAK